MKVRADELPQDMPLTRRQELGFVLDEILKLRHEIKHIETHLEIEASPEFNEPPKIEVPSD